MSEEETTFSKKDSKNRQYALSWISSYNGSQIETLYDGTYCFKCGNNIKFCTEEGVESLYSSAGEGIGVLSTHKSNLMFAYSENIPNPAIFIVTYPSYEVAAVLRDTELLEYLTIEFSSSHVLAAISGIPNYELTIWRYTDEAKLYSCKLSHNVPNMFIFNPLSWRQFALCSEKELILWTFDQNSDAKMRHIGLPCVDGSKKDALYDYSVMASYSTNDLVKSFLNLPRSCIVGLTGTELEDFEHYLQNNVKVIPQCLYWSTDGTLFVGCRSGQILKINPENYELVTVFQEVSASTPNESVSKLEEQTRMIKSMVYYKKLFVMGGSDKILRFFEMTGSDSYKLLDSVMIGQKISSLCFTGSQGKLLIGTEEGSLYYVMLSNPKKVIEMFSYENSSIISIGILPMFSTHFVTMKKSGLANVWGGDGKIVSSLQLDPRMEVTVMAVSCLLNMIVVGTSIGVVFVGTFISFAEPKWMSCLRVHCGEVKSIKFFKNGRFMAVGYSDGLVFLLSGVPSKNFEVIGYMEFEGMLLNISTSESIKRFGLVVLTQVSESRQLLSFVSFDKETLTRKPEMLVDKRYRFNLAMLKRVVCPMDVPVIDVVLLGLDRVIVSHSNKNIVDYIVADYNNLERMSFAKASLRPSISASERSTEEPPTEGKKSKPRTPSVMSYRKKNRRSRSATTLSESMKANKGYPSSSKKQMLSSQEGRGTLESLELTNFDVEDIFKTSQEDDYMLDLRKVDKFESHKLVCSFLEVSHTEKWIVTGGQDGVVKIHDINSHELLWSLPCMDFWNKGITHLAMSPDSQKIACSGSNNIFCSLQLVQMLTSIESDYQDVFKMQTDVVSAFYNSIKHEQRNEHMEFGRLGALTQTFIQKESFCPVTVDKATTVADIEYAIKMDEIYAPVLTKPGPDSSWLEVRKHEALEDEEASVNPLKLQLRTKIRRLRRKLRKMMNDNEEASELEKLPHCEFDLDLEEQKNLRAACEAEVQKLRDEKEKENTTKKHLTERIKQECWDEMFIKGRGIKSFSSEHFVDNYPMKERTKEEIHELKIVSAQRRVEIADDLMRIKCKDLLLLKKSKHSVKSEDENEKEESSIDRKLHNTITGSLGSLVGGDSDLFYSQFELCTKFQKIKQIVLLKDAIYRIKTAFNKEFDQLLVKKEQDIAKIKEKNQRIRKILKDIDSNEVVSDPELTSAERPELLFFTSDDEVAPKTSTELFKKLRTYVKHVPVKVDKYLTPEQWKRQEEEKKYEEERKLREKRDNWRERGLELMMGGLLEIKKEDELKKDIPMPVCMVEKPEDKWTEDDRKLVSEYKINLKELEEEREKYKKSLEVELKKLQAFVSDTIHDFDEKLSFLISKKILVQSAIQQEELKIYRLRYSLLLEEQLNIRERQLFNQLEEAKEKSNQALISSMQARKQLDESQAMYESHVDEDKVHERMFKKEFHEVPHTHIDALFKQYKKRPKGLKGKQLDISSQDVTILLSVTDKPFALRNSAVYNTAEDYHAIVSITMADLDSSKNMPEGLNPAFWQQLCTYRHEKIFKEVMLKNEAHKIADMQNTVSRLQSDAEKAKQEIDDVFNSINQLQFAWHQFYRNLELQLLLKQGQVEVYTADFLPNYRSSLLINKEVIEELNKNIKALGENKIATMIESKDFKKGIVQLEWEHKKMEMQLQDLKNKMKDIANFKVTKEVLFFLKKQNYDELKSQEVIALEKAINMTKEYHKKKLELKNEKLQSVEKSIKSINDHNEQLVNELKQLNTTIIERKQIHDIVVDKSGMAKLEQEKRHKSIVKKSKLLELAKAQSEEIKNLKKEITTLKNKTFPALNPADHDAH